MTLHHPHSILHRYFAGLAESIFEAELGVVDPPLIDYLSELLVRFVRLDATDRRQGQEARPLEEVSRLASDAVLRVGQARRDIYRQIGDLSLFWTGLFPEALRRTVVDPATDPFHDFCDQGKRSYLIASRIEIGGPPADSDAANDVLERLGRQFEMCAYGLREVRREWERPDTHGGSPPPLLLG